MAESFADRVLGDGSNPAEDGKMKGVVQMGTRDALDASYDVAMLLKSHA
jgi:hypothetical protein